MRLSRLLPVALALATGAALSGCVSSRQHAIEPIGAVVSSAMSAVMHITISAFVEPVAIMAMIARDLHDAGWDAAEHVAVPEDMKISMYVHDVGSDPQAESLLQHPSVVARITITPQGHPLPPVLERLEPTTRPALQLPNDLREIWLPDDQADQASSYCYPNATPEEALIAVAPDRQALCIYLSAP